MLGMGCGAAAARHTRALDYRMVLTARLWDRVRSMAAGRLLREAMMIKLFLESRLGSDCLHNRC
jgi:hypothetical protein